VSDDRIPSCVCTAHPKGEDRLKYMFVAECTNEFVTFCCKRCSEITHTAVVQVRTLKYAREKGAYEVAQKRKGMSPELLKLLHARTKGRIRMHEMEDRHA
jgi:hypothetical protein